MRGKVFLFGDFVDTDVIAPGSVLHLGIETLKMHTMEAINPDFHKLVQPGDIIIAGKSFGLGSSREQAAMVLKNLGISLILAQSFARIFFRNAINIGLQLGTVNEKINIKTGQLVEYSISGEYVIDLKTKKRYLFNSYPGLIKEIVACGGIINYIKKYSCINGFLLCY